MPQQTAIDTLDSLDAALPLKAHLPSSALATLAATAVGSFSNLSTHLPQQNLATNSTELEPSPSLPLNGHVLLMQSSANTDDKDNEATPTTANANFSKDFMPFF